MDYIKKHYDQFSLRFLKGDREKYKELAEEQGKSLNQLIIELLDAESARVRENEQKKRVVAYAKMLTDTGLSEKVINSICDVARDNQVKKILLSSMGIHFDVIEYDPIFGEVSYIGFKTAVLLKDGTRISLDGGGGGSMSEGDQTRKFSYYGRFDIPIPREEIGAIVICDTTYELNDLN